MVCRRIDVHFTNAAEKSLWRSRSHWRKGEQARFGDGANGAYSRQWS